MSRPTCSHRNGKLEMEIAFCFETHLVDCGALMMQTKETTKERQRQRQRQRQRDKDENTEHRKRGKPSCGAVEQSETERKKE